MLLLWPLLSGQILFGGARSDMFIAGYSFRLFGAESFLSTGRIPQWNPYLFGGLPYVGAMHGDIFYPTAWLRWVMPVDLAITWGMVLHFVLAGWFMYRFCRALGLTWGGALFAGIAYELTGIVASQMSPGHDGKLFVSALAPLAFWVLLHAIRRRRTWAFGAFALVTALIVLGHYHMAYFLFIALGLWALFLVFWDAEKTQDGRPWRDLAFATAAVVVGVGIAALQVLPFLEYIPFSPRASGGPDTGWGFATSYALPPSDLFTVLLPEFNGILDHYWGSNPLKFHTEYVGFLPLALAAFALGDRNRRRLVVAFALGGLFFLLFAFGGHTPFYRPFFELLPLLKKIRAMGMVFYLVAFALSVLAGIGLDRVLARAVPIRTILLVSGGIAAFALLGAIGGLQGLAVTLAIPERLDAVDANAPFLRAGAMRLLVVAVLGGAILWASATGRFSRRIALAVLTAFAAVDLWSVDRAFFEFSPRARVLFADDAVTAHLRSVPMPYRVLDAGNSYPQSILMAYRVPVALGYHGFQLQRYNDLVGVRTGFDNLQTPNVLDLLAIRFLILPKTMTVQGYHQVVAPTPTAFGTTAALYERDTLPAYARVLPMSARLTDDQTLATLVDSRFPVSRVALLPDSATPTSPAARQPFAAPTVAATVRSWRPGAMSITLTGTSVTPGHLLVSENWYPGWRAEVDTKPVPVRRLDHTLIGVDLPPGAREVTLHFEAPSYERGKLISILALVVAVGMILVPAALLARAKSVPSAEGA